MVTNFGFIIFFLIWRQYIFFISSVFSWVPKVVRESKKLALSLTLVAFWHSRYLCILVTPNFQGGTYGRTVQHIGKCH